MSTLPSPARDLSERLSAQALAVCRTYLSNGRRCGRYWTVGDVLNEPGRSLYVRLDGPTRGQGAAGHWTDAATGEHGDLVDLIRANLGLGSLREALDEAREFLNLSRPASEVPTRSPRNSSLAARRLFAMGVGVPGTLAERYLRARGITAAIDAAALRFHPRVFCRELGPEAALPALLAAMTDGFGQVTGVQRTWLDAARLDKARLREPRRSLGCQLGHGVRFEGRDADGVPVRDLLFAGEGLETMLSLKSALPRLPAVAGLSANHLAALELPTRLRRLYVARDRDREGARAAGQLRARAEERGVEVLDLLPKCGDFNVDLVRFGVAALRARLAGQLDPGDATRVGADLRA